MEREEEERPHMLGRKDKVERVKGENRKNREKVKGIIGFSLFQL